MEDLMLNRRQTLQAGIALGALSVGAPLDVLAQSKPVKIRYSEVVRSILYAPAYVAMTKGFFAEAGLEGEMTTAPRRDKSIAAPLSGAVHLSLMGPEAPIYV